MIIKASSKDYEVTVNNNFDVIEKLQIDIMILLKK